MHLVRRMRANWGTHQYPKPERAPGRTAPSPCALSRVARHNDLGAPPGPLALFAVPFRPRVRAPNLACSRTSSARRVDDLSFARGKGCGPSPPDSWCRQRGNWMIVSMPACQRPPRARCSRVAGGRTTKKGSRTGLRPISGTACVNHDVPTPSPSGPEVAGRQRHRPPGSFPIRRDLGGPNLDAQEAS